MAYLGAISPSYDPTRAVVPQLDAERFSGNDVLTSFTMLRSVTGPVDVDVYVENVKQEPVTAYTTSGTTLTFTEAPPTGVNNIYVIYRSSVVNNYAQVPDGSITYAKLANSIRNFTVDKFTANGTGQTYTLSENPASANTLAVTIDGVAQAYPENFSVSGTTLIFTEAPDASSNVVVKHLGFRTTTEVTVLSDGSVTTSKIADANVTTGKIATGAVTGDKIGLTAINANNIVDGTITNAKLATPFSTGKAIAMSIVFS